MNTKERMKQAYELIQERRYQEAKKILQKIDHPRAREWIAKLENSKNPQNKEVAQLKAQLRQIEDDLEKAEKNIRTATIVVVFCLFTIIGWILLPIALPQYFVNKRRAGKLRKQRLDLTYKLAEYGIT